MEIKHQSNLSDQCGSFDNVDIEPINADYNLNSDEIKKLLADIEAVEVTTNHKATQLLGKSGAKTGPIMPVNSEHRDKDIVKAKNLAEEEMAK